MIITILRIRTLMLITLTSTGLIEIQPSRCSEPLFST